MTKTPTRTGAPLRISDIVPLRRMLGADSLVIRVNPDRSFNQFERMPALFFTAALRHAISDQQRDRFEAACREAISTGSALAFRPGDSSEVMITPILDDLGNNCRFLVCWARGSSPRDVTTGHSLPWDLLQLADVSVHFRTISDDGTTHIEAAPWWTAPGREPIELWNHHKKVSAWGLGHAVIEKVIFEACDVAAENGENIAVRLDVPSADILVGLIPVFHGALKATGVDACRIIAAVPVELAVDPDLLPVIVHLRTMGLQIDIVGLDALTHTLHTVSDTSDHTHLLVPPTERTVGDWSPPLH